MPFFTRKRPETFEAHQYKGPPHVPLGHPLPAAPEGVKFKLLDINDGLVYPFVTTAHNQNVYLVPGDWIRKEPVGDGYYPIKDDIMTEFFTEVSRPPA